MMTWRNCNKNSQMEGVETFYNLLKEVKSEDDELATWEIIRVHLKPAKYKYRRMI